MPIKDLKILVVDDDSGWLLEVKKILRRAEFQYVRLAESVSKAKAEIQRQQPNLLVCNEILENGNALELLKTEIAGCSTIITSDQPERTTLLQTTELLNCLYLAKPFHEYTLLSSIRFLLKHQATDFPPPDQFITVRNAKKTQKIFFTSIVWVKAEGNYIMIHTVAEKTYALKKSLVRLLDELDERFVRVHKSHVINTHHIKRIDFSQMQVLVDRVELPIGREYRLGLEAL